MGMMLKMSICTAAVAFLVGGVSGCSSADTPNAEGPSPSAATQQQSKIFEGTLEEHTVALVNCMTESGFPTKVITQAGDDPQFEVDTGSDSEEAFDASQKAMENCTAKIGNLPDHGDLSEESAREMFEWVSGQHACIETAGFSVTPMRTWESYWDEVMRTDGLEGDAFGYLVNIGDYSSAMAACPRTTESW